MHARQRWRIAGLTGLLMVAAACGSRLPEDALAEIDGARPQGPDDGELVVPSGDGEDAASDAGDGLGPTETTAPGALAPQQGGGPAAAAAEGECRGGATDVGVTENEITVAGMVTASGPLPGATEGAYRGAAAYFAKVNAEGGVCGRKITILKGDDGLDPARGRAEFTRLEPQVLAFVGNRAVADSGFLDLIEKTNVPWFGSPTDPAGRGLPSVVPKSPGNVTFTGPFEWFRREHPDAKKVAFLYTDVGGVRANTPQGREALKAAGYEIVYDSGAQATSPDYTADVINMRNAGADVVYLYAFEVNMQVRLARNMRQQGYEPELKITQIGYNSKLTELLGDLADGWTSHLTYLPVINEDEPARSPAVADFVQWNRRSFPSGQIDLFPVSGWSDAALFVQALRSLGPDVTRQGIIDAVDQTITEHDGGGISAPTNPSAHTTPECFVIVRVEGATWKRAHPDAGYDCDLGETISY